MPGKLYLVPTPIGNLQDITLRALDTLRNVNLIAAEDTRRASILLRHFEIAKPTISYHDFNERETAPKLVAKIMAGENVALITDAGSPGISDPAFYLVREAIGHNIIVEALPGPTALIPALVLSGLPCHRFVFEGFPPAKKGRQTFFQALATEARTIVLYEAPHRIVATLEAVLKFWGDRRLALARELTKIHEEVWRGRVSELLENLTQRTLKGECVLVIEGSPTQKVSHRQERDNGNEEATQAE